MSQVDLTDPVAHQLRAQQILQQEEQRETARELADVLRIAQEMGQRLAKETHGDLYQDVRTLNENLSALRLDLDNILDSLPPT